MRSFLFTLLAVSLMAAGCAVEPIPTPQSNANRTGNQATNSGLQANTNTNSAARKNSIDWAVTLPVLDAFLSDETFVQEAKTELQITDEQMSALADASRKATMELDKEETTTPSGALAGRMRAESEVNKVIGEEKSKRLLEMVAERWAGTDIGSMLTRPGLPPVDSRIVVNIPAFRMDVFEEGRLLKTYMVGIGYPEFPLPTGLRKAEQIIFNPPWTPPDSPWVEKMGSRIQSGKTIKPGDRLNPLGVLKVPIGLPSLIHGGKKPAQIGTFASHGCVGLTDAQAKDFSKFLARLGGAELTDAQIAAHGRNRAKTETLKLATPVLIELRYETIVVEDGAVHVYRDLYNRGTNTEEDLRAALEAAGSSVEALSENERAQLLAKLSEMSRDPSGKLPANAGGNSKASAAGGSTASDRAESSRSGKVTRTIKGQKDAVVGIAALSGKGYPRAINVDAGRGK